MVDLAKKQTALPFNEQGGSGVCVRCHPSPDGKRILQIVACTDSAGTPYLHVVVPLCKEHNATPIIAERKIV